MRKPQKKSFGFWVVGFVFLPAVLFQGGCGLISLIGTPTRHEKKVRAEYDLTGDKDRRMLVLVNQPSWLDAQANLRYYVTARMNEQLSKKTKIRPGNLVPYSAVSEFRSNRGDYAFLSPAAVGAALKADTVLFVTINSHELNNLDAMGYFKGFVSAECALYDVPTGKKLWPGSAASKSVKVGFDIESGGREAAVDRLAGSLAHCTVRYFYDCPEDQFKIADDKSNIAWESWRKERASGDTQ
ncbi:MAG: hypothetical protein ACYTEQ_12145 [Planctomycetota bacterium]|jgi:hypothetical protein